MSSYAHARMRRLPQGNPPSAGIKRQCTGEVSIHTEENTRRGENPSQCKNGAAWWVPEAAYCTSHMPVEWLVAVMERVRLWNDLADDLWQEVLASTPLPPPGDDPPGTATLCQRA